MAVQWLARLHGPGDSTSGAVAVMKRKAGLVLIPNLGRTRKRTSCTTPRLKRLRLFSKVASVSAKLLFLGIYIYICLMRGCFGAKIFDGNELLNELPVDPSCCGQLLRMRQDFIYARFAWDDQRNCFDGFQSTVIFRALFPVTLKYGQ